MSRPGRNSSTCKASPGRRARVDHITVRNITGSFGSFGSVRGNVANPQRGTLGDTISDFTFENINVTLRNPALSRGEVDNFTFNNVVVNGQAAAAPPATTGFGRRGGRRGGAPNLPAATPAASSDAASSTSQPTAPPAAATP